MLRLPRGGSRSPAPAPRGGPRTRTPKPRAKAPPPRRAKPLAEWDNSTSDLSRYRLEPRLQLQRRLERISPHHESAANEYAAKMTAMAEDLTPFLLEKRLQETESGRHVPGAPAWRLASTLEKHSPAKRPEVKAGATPARKAEARTPEKRTPEKLFAPPRRGGGKVVELADELAAWASGPRRQNSATLAGGKAGKKAAPPGPSTPTPGKKAAPRQCAERSTTPELQQLEEEVRLLESRLETERLLPPEPPAPLPRPPLSPEEVRALVAELTGAGRARAREPSPETESRETPRSARSEGARADLGDEERGPSVCELPISTLFNL